MNYLISFSENDKRILLALLLLVIFIFVLVGYLGLLIEHIMKRQGNRISKEMHNVVAAKVITTKKDFIKLANKKNNRLFVKQAYIAVLILLSGGLVYVIYGAITHNWALKLFDYKKEGFSTLLFLWDFPNAPRTKFFGMEIICGWPPLLNKPHFEMTAFASYLIVPCLVVGCIWLLIASQAHIARFVKAQKLAKRIFVPTLETYTPSPINTFNNPNPPQQ